MERLSRGRAQRIASSRAKWNEHGLKMLPRGLPNRSKIAPRWLPGGSRATPESANESVTLVAPFFGLWGGSRGAPGSLLAAPGALLAPLGPCLALPGRSWEPFSSPRGLLWDLFGSLFPTPLEKHENLDFRRQLQRKSRFWRPRGVQHRTQMAPKSLLGASWHLLALTWRFSALSWRLWAASWGLLGASWAAFGPKRRSKQKPGYHGTGSAFSERAASTASG